MAADEERRDRLVVRKVIPAPREEVFAAWIDPESLRDWMCPGDMLTADAQIDARVGGAFRIVMKDATRAVHHTGEYLILEPPSKLVFTWISNSTGNRPTLATVELFEHGDACEVVLTHDRFVDPDEVRRHTRGWQHPRQTGGPVCAARRHGAMRPASRCEVRRIPGR